jgi:hypothetical protein
MVTDIWCLVRTWCVLSVLSGCSSVPRPTLDELMVGKNGRYQHWLQTDLPAKVSNKVKGIEVIEVHAAALWINSAAKCRLLTVESDAPIYFSTYGSDSDRMGQNLAIGGSVKRWGYPTQQCDIQINPAAPNRVSIIVHELMHCLGFAHDGQIESIMAPGMTPFAQIQPEDAMLMNKLYCQ